MSCHIYRSIIFDLDGTLVDSLPGIAESLRKAVSLVDPSLDLSDLKNHIGPQLPVMISLMWPDLAEEVRIKVLQEFRLDYNVRGCLFSAPYAGIVEMLRQLKSLEITLFVLTNKPDAPTRKILAHFGLEGHFTEILSPDSVTPHLTSKSAGAHLLAEKHGLIAGETLLVGDSQDDLKAAESAGFTFLEASYGYGLSNENVTQRTWLQLKTPSDLATLIHSPLSS